MALLKFLLGEKAARKIDSYKAFTRRYDRTVAAENLDSAIGTLGSNSANALDLAWQEYRDGLAGWKIKANLKILEAAGALRDRLTDAQRKDTLLTILIDQSGSMRGPKMLMTAMASDIFQATMTGIGFNCEVLGFTTIGWHGGRSRRRWKWTARPNNPGRLCDLLHIIYKDAADKRASTDGWQFRQMLRPDLPKENVDGEAIEWAASRMRSHCSTRKVLIVISDGAPADDSTILANGVDYLPQHLKAVLQNIDAAGDIDVCALGLAHDVERYYRVWDRVEVPQDLPAAFAALCERMFLTTSNKA
jgi:cobaltochelatase CobT